MITWEFCIFSMALAAVIIGCLVPAGWLPALPNDKLLHFLAYGMLTLMAEHIAGNRAELRFWLLGLLIAGWAIELLQNWVPGRKFCWRDIGANAAGILVAVLCAPLLLQHKLI